MRRGVLRPILFVAKGLFYKAALTSDPYRTVPVASNGAGRVGAAGRSLGQIAEFVDANIYLTHSNKALVLRAGRNGPELLRLKREEGTTYEITVENGCSRTIKFLPEQTVTSLFENWYCGNNQDEVLIWRDVSNSGFRDSDN